MYDANKIELFLEDLKVLVAASQKKGFAAGLTNAWNYAYNMDWTVLGNPFQTATALYDVGK